MSKSCERIRESEFSSLQFCYILSLHSWSLSSFIRFGVSFPSSSITVEFQIWTMTVIIIESFSNSLMGYENVFEWALPLRPCSDPKNYSPIGDNQDTQNIDKNCFFWGLAIGRIFLSGKNKLKLRKQINNAQLVNVIVKKKK